MTEKTIEDLFEELRGYEDGLKVSQRKVIDTQGNVRMFESHIERTLKEIATLMVESNEYQFKHESGVVIDFYYPTPRKSIDVPDANAVPDDFCRIKREPDKLKIKDHLDAGNRPNWASERTSTPKLTYKFIKEI